LIEESGRYLVAMRKTDDSFGGCWEFPGGAVEEGETMEEALKREIKEELDIEISVGKDAFQFVTETPRFKIDIHLFESKIEKGMPKAIDCDEVRWVTLDELDTLEIIPADKEAVEWLRRR